MTQGFHRLHVAETISEIDGGAKSVVFDLSEAQAAQFDWHAGQHLTLRLDLDGHEQRRSYTISNPPGAALRITVKRVPEGVVSNHICDALEPGDIIEAMPPFGGFSLIPGATARRTHYFFGAGSGITPLYAMINTVLAHEPHSVAHLVYGNADASSILFLDALEALQEAHPDRFTLRHVLSSPSIWSWFTPWRTGRVDAVAIKAAIGAAPPVAQDVQYWICGPGGMNADVRAALMALDAPAGRIHMESFGGEAELDTSVTGMAATAEVTLNGARQEVPVAEGQTLLEAMRAAGLSPPFSCQSGVCGACRAHLTEGRVHHRARMALEDGDIAGGAVLTCQAVPTADHVAVEFAE